MPSVIDRWKNRLRTGKNRRTHRRLKSFERLEDRRVLATILWDGEASTADWFTPANWSTDQLPTAGDEVVLPARSNVQLGRDVQVAKIRVEEDASLLIGVDGTEADQRSTIRSQLIIDGQVSARRTVELIGDTRIGATGALIAAAASSNTKPFTYNGNSTILVQGTFENLGLIELVSQSIDSNHPCCGGARAEIELAEDTVLLNQGTFRTTMPLHGLRLADIHYALNGDVINEGQVELGFHLQSNDHQFVNRGEVLISDYESNGTLFDSIWELGNALLIQDGGEILGDGQIKLTDSNIDLQSSWTLDAESASMTIIRTDFLQSKNESASLTIAEDRSQLFFQSDIAVPLIVDGGFAVRGLVNVMDTFTTSPTSMIRLSPYGRAYIQEPQQGDAILNVHGDWENKGQINFRGSQTKNGNVGHDLLIETIDGRLTNSGTIHLQDPDYDQNYNYRIVGNWDNTGQVLVDYDTTFTGSTDATLAGDVTLGRYQHGSEERKAELFLHQATLIYAGANISGESRVDIREATLELAEPLVYDAEEFQLTLHRASIAGSETFQIAQDTSLFLFTTDIAAPFLLEGRATFRGTSQIGGQLDISPGGLLDIQGFRDRFYYSHPTDGNSVVVVNQGFTNRGDIRIWSSAGFNPGSIGNTGSENRLEINTGTLINQGRIYTQPPSNSSHQTYLQLLGSIRNEGLIEIEGRDLRIETLENAGQIEVGPDVSLYVDGSAQQTSGRINLQDGNIEFSSAADKTFTLAGGTMTGQGEILGGLDILSATVAPGNENSSGVINVRSALSLSDDSRLEIDIFGTEAGQFDRLTSNNNVSLGGTLAVNTVSPETITVGNQLVPASFNAGGGSGFDTFEANLISTDLRWDPSYTASATTLTAVEVDDTFLADLARQQWNAGAQAIRDSFATWLDQIDAAIDEMPGIDGSVTTLTNARNTLNDWATTHLQTIPTPSTPWTSLEPLRTTLESFGHTDVVVFGDATSNGDLLRVPVSRSFDQLVGSHALASDLVASLQGLAPSAALNGGLNLSAVLNLDWILGVDPVGFFMQSDEAIEFSLTSTASLAGEAQLAARSKLSFLSSSDYQQTGSYAVDTGTPTTRQRLASFDAPTWPTVVDSQATVDLRGLLEWDEIVTGFTLNDSWTIDHTQSGTSVTPDLASLSLEDFASGIVESLQVAVDEFLPQEWTDRLTDVALPLLGNQTPRASAELGSPQPAWWHTAMDSLSNLFLPSTGEPVRGLAGPVGGSFTRAGELRLATGATGRNVSIGVITSGLGDASPSIRSGDLPAISGPGQAVFPSLEILSQGNSGTGSSLAILETLHDVAPEARLVYQAAQDELEFQLAIRSMQDAGVEILITDLQFERDPAWGDGPSADAIRELTNAGTLVVAPAGDHGLNQIEQTALPEARSSRLLHRFQSGNGDSGFVVAVKSPTPGDYRLDLHWRDSTGDNLDRSSATPQLTQVAYSTEDEQIIEFGRQASIDPIRSYSQATISTETVDELSYFVIELPDATIPFDLQLVGSAGLEIVNLPASQLGQNAISGIAAVPEVLTVGSVEADSQLSAISSSGPSTVGNTVRNSLDVIAPGVAFVHGDGRGTPAQGTRIAAAHVAANAALLWDLLDRDGRNLTTAAGDISQALKSTASNASNPDQQSGFGIIDSVAASNALNLDISDDPLTPVIYSTLERLARQGVTINANTDELRAFLSGESPSTPFMEITVDRQQFDNGKLQGAFSFDFGRDVLGALGDLEFAGELLGSLEPAALLQFGFDSSGFFLDSTSWVGGRVSLEPRLTARWNASEISLGGTITAAPKLGFATGSPQVRFANLVNSFANLEIGLQPLEPTQATTIAGALDSSIEFGFLDYVDADPFSPNTENGGDPFRMRLKTALQSDAQAFGFADFVGAAWEWTEFQLLNPDVDEDGQEDFTIAAFLENVARLGLDVLQGSGITDYLREVLGAFDADDLIPFEPRPRGILPETIESTPEAVIARQQIENSLRTKSGDELQNEINTTLSSWFLGGLADGEGETGSASVLGRLQRLNPFHDSFASNLDIDDFRSSLVSAVGDFQRFVSTALTLKGVADENLVGVLGQTAMSAAREHLVQAIKHAIQQAHDETLDLYHSDAPPRSNPDSSGPGYLDRAMDMFRWSQTAEYLGVSGVGTSPSWVMARFPVRVHTELFDFKKPVGHETLTTLGTEILQMRAGLQVKLPGTSLNLDPHSADYLEQFSAPDFGTGQLIVQLQSGENNSNEIVGQPVGKAFNFLPSLTGQGAFPRTWRPELSVGVRVPIGDVGLAETTVRFGGTDDTHLQVEGLIGLAELPLARAVSSRMEGRPSITLTAGLGGIETLTEEGTVVGPGQSVTIAAEVLHGQGSIANAPVTFTLIGSGSFSPVQNDVKAAASRTSAEGQAFTILYPPQAEEVSVISVGATYFLNGESFKQTLSLPLVTSGEDFSLMENFTHPANYSAQRSAQADALSTEQQNLLAASDGIVDDTVKTGLQPFVDAWITQGINPALQLALQAADDYDAAAAASGTGALQLWQLYREAKQRTRVAAAEVLDLWAHTELLELTIPAAQFDRIALDLRNVLAKAITRGIAQFQSGVPVTAMTSGPEPKPVPPGTPLFDALELATAARLLEPYSSQLAPNLPEQPPLLRFEEIIELAGVLSPTADAPQLSDDFDDLSLTGSIGLSNIGVQVISDGQGDPLPLEVDVEINDGFSIQTLNYLLDPQQQTPDSESGQLGVAQLYELPPNQIEINPLATRVSARLTYSIGALQLLTQELSSTASATLEIAGESNSQQSSTDSGALNLGVAEEASIQISLYRKQQALAGETVEISLLGLGDLTATSVEIAANGKAELGFTAPRFLSVDPNKRFGTTRLIASFWDGGELVSESLQINYEIIADLQQPLDPEKFHTPDHQRAAEQLAQATEDSWRLDPESNEWQIDTVAFQNSASLILQDWLSDSPNDFPDQSDPFGNVIYWLQQARQVQVDTAWTESATNQAFIRENDEPFREQFRRALRNYAVWKTAVYELGFEPSEFSTESVDVTSVDDLVKQLLEKGIEHQRLRAATRAAEYQALPANASQTAQREKVNQLIREGMISIQYAMEGSFREFWSVETGQELLDQLPFYIDFDLSEDATALDFGTSLTRAELRVAPVLYIEGVAEGLRLPDMPVTVTPLDESNVTKGLGVTDSNGFFHDQVTLGEGQDSVNLRVTSGLVSTGQAASPALGIRKLPAYGSITFGSIDLELAAKERLVVKAGPESAGIEGLSTNPLATRAGDRVLLELQLLRGNEGQAGQSLHISTIGAEQDQHRVLTTQLDGTVQLSLQPPAADQGAIHIRVRYLRNQQSIDLRNQQSIERELLVPYDSRINDLDSESDLILPAQRNAEKDIAKALSQADLQQLEQAEDLPADIRNQLRDVLLGWVQSNSDDGDALGLRQLIESASESNILTAISSYQAWRAWIDRLQLADLIVEDDAQSPAYQLKETLVTAVRGVIDTLITQAFEGARPNGDIGRRAMLVAAKAEVAGVDRGAGDADNDDYSVALIQSRIGLDLNLEEVEISGSDEAANLTVKVAATMNVADWNASQRVAATFTTPVDLQIVGYGAGVREPKSVGGGLYGAEAVIYSGATDADFSIVALDKQLSGFLRVSAQQVRLSTTTRIEPSGSIEGLPQTVVGDRFEISTHSTNSQTLLLNPGIVRGKAFQADPPVSAITSDSNLTIQPVADSNTLRITAAEGTSGEATLRLVTMLAGERVETEVTIAYSNSDPSSGEFSGLAQQANQGILSHPGITDALNGLALPLSSDSVGLGDAFGWDSLSIPWSGQQASSDNSSNSGQSDIFQIVDHIGLDDFADWIQNGLPTDQFDLIQFKIDLDNIELISTPLAYGTNGGGLFPPGLSGNMQLEELRLGGQLVFGVDTSVSPFYVVTRSQDESLPETTELTLEAAVNASLSSDQAWLDGLLNLGRIEGGFRSQIAIDFGATGGSDGRLRLEELGSLINTKAGFINSPVSDMQFTASGGLVIPGLEDSSGDALAAINLIGAAYTDRGIINDDFQIGLPPLVFELRSGTDFRLGEFDPQLAERLSSSPAFSPDDQFEGGSEWETIGSDAPSDLGDLDQLQVIEASLRDARDWYRFNLLNSGNATSFVQLDLDSKRGNVLIELYMEEFDDLGVREIRLVSRKSTANVDSVRLSLMGATGGTYFVSISADDDQLNPRYAVSFKPPAGLEEGVSANLAGLKLTNGAFAIEVHPETGLDAEFAARLGFPDSAGDGILFDVGLHASLGPQGNEPLVLDAQVVSTIGGPAMSIWYEPAPLAGKLEMNLLAASGGFFVFDYKSANDYKVAGLDAANSRWLIGEAGFDTDGRPTIIPSYTSAADVSDSVSIQLRYVDGQVTLGSQHDGNWTEHGSFDFGTSVGDGLLGLVSQSQAASFVNLRVQPIDPDSGLTGQTVFEPLVGYRTENWRVEQGAWQWTDDGYVGSPSSFALGDWVELHSAQLDASLRIDFNDASPLLVPEAIDASFMLTDVDASLFPSTDGTPLYPEQANSPRGMAVFSGGELIANQQGISLAVAEVRASILDIVDVSLTDVSLDLTSDLSQPLLATGGVELAIPFLSDDRNFISISAPTSGALLGITKPNLVDANPNNNLPALVFLQDGVEVSLDPTLLTEDMDLSGLLPLNVEQLELNFHAPRTSLLDASLSVAATLNMGLLDGLPFTPVLAVGGEDLDDCDDVVTLPGGEQLCGNGRLEGTIYPAALLSGNPAMVFEELGPIYLGIDDWRLIDDLNGEPLTIGGYLKIGAFSQGVFDGELRGIMEMVYGNPASPQAQASVEASGTLTQQTTDSSTITRAEIDWIGQGGGQFAFLAAEGSEIAFNTWIQNTADASGPFNVEAGGELSELSTGEVRISIGPYIELVGAATFNLDAGPNEPFAVLETAGVEFDSELPSGLSWLSNITFEAGGFGIGNDGTVYVMPGAYFRAASSPDVGGNLLGLPSWIPITMTEIGLRFDGDGPDDEPLDVTLDGALTDPGATFSPLLNPENFTLIFSGGLQGDPDGLPITGRVNKLEVDLQDLADFAVNECYASPGMWGSSACPLPIEDLAGFTIAIEPFTLGGIEIGGSLGLGVEQILLPDGSEESAFYGRISGQFAYGDMGLGAEIILTQYGPVLARLFAGVPIPIGALVGAAAGSVVPGLGTGIGASVGAQTGFMLTGFEGALIFGDADSGNASPPDNPLSILSNPEFVAPTRITDDRLISVMQNTAQRRHDVAQQLNSDSDPNNDVDCSAFPPGINELQTCYTWSDGFQLVGSGVITNIHVQNQIGGKVTLGMNLGFDAPQDGGSPLETKVFLRGDLELSGQGVGTALAVLDFSDREVDGQTVFGPLNPVFSVAAGLPGSGGWLSTLMPLEAQIGAQLDTKGVAEASVALVRSLIDSGGSYLDQLLIGLAGQFEQRKQALLAQRTQLIELRDRAADLLGTSHPEYLRAVEALAKFDQRSDSLYAILDLDADLGAGTYNVDLSPGEWERVIDGGFLKARLLGGDLDGEAIDGLLPASLNELSAARINLATLIASDLVVELYNLVASVGSDGQFIYPSPPTPEPGNALANSIYQAALSGIDSSIAALDTAQQNAISGLATLQERTDAQQALDRTLQTTRRQAEFAATLAANLFESLVAAGGSAADAFFEVLDPSFQLRGHIQPVLLGIPLGQPRERIFAEITKESLSLDGSFSIISRLLTLAGIPLPLDDRLTANIYVPFENLYEDIFTYQLPQLDLEAGKPWQVALSGAAEFAGFELGQIAGAIFPGGKNDPQLTEDVTKLLLGDAGAQTNSDGSPRYPGIVTTNVPTNGIRPDRVYVKSENFDKLVEAGGLLVDGRLTIPRLLTEPLTLFQEIGSSVWDDFRSFVESDLQDGQSCWDDNAPLLTNVFACLSQNPQAAMDFLSGRLSDVSSINAVQQVAQMQLFVPNFFSELMDAIGGATAIENLTAEELYSNLETAAAGLSGDISQLWQEFGYFQGEWGGGLREPGEAAAATTDKLLGIPFGGAEIEVIGDRLAVKGDYLGVPMQFMVDLGFDRAESFTDLNANGRWDQAEPPLLAAGQPQYDAEGNQLFVDLNFNGVWEKTDEPFSDRNGNGTRDAGVPRAGAEVVFGSAPSSFQSDQLLSGPSGFGRSTAETAALQEFLGQIGLVVSGGSGLEVPSWLNLSGGAAFRAFSPGFDSNPDSERLKRVGGIQLLAELELASLFTGNFAFEITPGDQGIDFKAAAEIEEFLPNVPLPVAPGANGLKFELAKQASQLQAKLTGSVSLLGAEIPIPESLPNAANNNLIQLTEDGISAEIRLTNVGDRLRNARQAHAITMSLDSFDLDGDVFLLQFSTSGGQVEGSLRVEGGSLTLPGFELTNASFEITQQNSSLSLTVSDGRLDLGYLVAENFSGELTIDLSNPLVATVEQFSLSADWSVNVPLTPIPLQGFLDWFTAGQLVGTGQVNIDYQPGFSTPLIATGSFDGSFDPNGNIQDDEIELFNLLLDEAGCLRFDADNASAALPLPGGSCDTYVEDIVIFSIDSSVSVVEPDQGQSQAVPGFEVSLDISDLDHLPTDQTISVSVDYEIVAASTATRGQDFSAPQISGQPAVGTLNFSFKPKETVNGKFIPITILGDDEFEDDESIIIRLVNPKGSGAIAPAITNSIGIITIRNDDPPAPIPTPPNALLTWSMEAVIGEQWVLERGPTFIAETPLGLASGGLISHRGGISSSSGLVSDAYDSDGAYIGSVGIGVRESSFIGPISSDAYTSTSNIPVGPAYVGGNFEPFDSVTALAIDPRPYFEFSVDAGNVSNALDLTGIDFWARSGDGSTLRSWELKSSIDGFRGTIASSGSETEAADPQQNNFAHYQRDLDWTNLANDLPVPCAGGTTLRIYYDQSSDDAWLLDQLTIQGQLQQSCALDLTPDEDQLEDWIDNLGGALPSQVEIEPDDPSLPDSPPIYVDSYVGQPVETGEPVHIVDITIPPEEATANLVSISLLAATPPGGGSGEGEAMRVAPIELRVRGKFSKLDLTALGEINGRIHLEHAPEQGIVAHRFGKDFELFVAGKAIDTLDLLLQQGADEGAKLRFAGDLRLQIDSRGWQAGGLIEAGSISTANIVGDLGATVKIERGFKLVEIRGNLSSPKFQVGASAKANAVNGDRLTITDGDLLGELSLNGSVGHLEIIGGNLIGSVFATGRLGILTVQYDQESSKGGTVSGLIEATSIDSLFVIGGDLKSTIRTTDRDHDALRVVSKPVAGRGGRITSRSSFHIAGGVTEITGTTVSLGLHAGGKVKEINAIRDPNSDRSLLDASLNAHTFGSVRVIGGTLDATINPTAEAWEVSDGVVVQRIELNESRWIEGGISLLAGTKVGAVVADGVVQKFDGEHALRLPRFRLEPQRTGLAVDFDVRSTLHQHYNNPLDVNADGIVSPIDVLLVINQLNDTGSGTLPINPQQDPEYFLDVSGDNLLSPIDALLVINALNDRAAAGQGEGEINLQLEYAKTHPLAHDSALASLTYFCEGEDDDDEPKQ